MIFTLRFETYDNSFDLNDYLEFLRDDTEIKTVERIEHNENNP